MLTGSTRSDPLSFETKRRHREEEREREREDKIFVFVSEKIEEQIEWLRNCTRRRGGKLVDLTWSLAEMFFPLSISLPQFSCKLGRCSVALLLT